MYLKTQYKYLIEFFRVITIVPYLFVEQRVPEKLTQWAGQQWKYWNNKYELAKERYFELATSYLEVYNENVAGLR